MSPTMIYAIGALVFLAAFVGDALWAYYIRHAALRNPFRASISGAAIVLISGFTTVEYVKTPILLGVAALGGFLGTYLAVRRSN